MSEFAKMTTGEAYEGNQQFRAYGMQRYCPICQCHGSQGGGHIRLVRGIRFWVCKKHERPVK